MGAFKILIAEDNPGDASILEHILREDGYQAHCVKEGWRVVETVQALQPDLILLNIMMAGLNGLDTCRQLKCNPESAWIPIIMLMERSREPDAVLGLEEGAEDYVTKPFSIRVLQARIKNILRREKDVTPAEERIVRGDLEIDPRRREARVKGAPVNLTKTEFDLLRFLARRPGRVFSRNDILKGSWPDGVFVNDRSVDVHVASLRKKLGGACGCIETSRGIGYRFAGESRTAGRER